MSAAFKSGGRGTFVIDKRFPAVGRICRASGTTDGKLFDKLCLMLEELSAHHQLETLRAIRDGKLKLLEVWASYRTYGVKRLPSVELAQSLATAVRAWLAGVDVKEKTARDYRYAFEKFVTPESMISDLPRLLARYRDGAKGRMFNLARAAAQAFARDTLGRDSELWQQVAALRPKTVHRKPGHPLSPAAARVVVRALKDRGMMWWAMCSTGMGPGEYWGAWEVEDGGIRIHGTKREARDRVVPQVFTPVHPTVLYPAFRRSLKAFDPILTVYDARRTFAHWLELANIPKSRCLRYMGHALTRVDELYTDHDPSAFLIEDAAALKRFVGREPSALRMAR